MDSWKVKVHPRQPVTYLWGGEKVSIPLDATLLLTIRVDELGETIEFGSQGKSSTPKMTLGTLEAGESFAVSLKGLCGIWAKCVDPKVDSHVYCGIQIPSPT